MTKLSLGILIAALLAVFFCGTSYADSETDYHYYMVLGIRAFDKGFYDKAIWYFEEAQAVDPTKSTPLKYIKLIKRFKEGRLSVVQPPVRQKKGAPTPVAQEKSVIEQHLATSRKMIEAKDMVLQPKEAEVLVLNDQFWSLQPNLELEIETNKVYVFQGQNVKRFLSVKEGVLDVDRLDKDRISISAKNRASTFFHVWDDRGRWTFHVQGKLPVLYQNTRAQQFKDTGMEDNPPLKIAYSNNWGAIYRGNSIPDMERSSLTFTQWVGTHGRIPYGNFDASMNFYKYAESTERIGERMGLGDGRIGPFKDFNIRGFDTEVYLSDFSVPGRSFRGVRFDSYAFNRRLNYTLFQGQDRAQFLFISPSILDVRKTYIEGASATLFPDSDHNYTINYARGYGDYRDNFLKNKAFSAETEHKFYNLKVSGEVGYDEDVYSEVIRTEFKRYNHTLNVNVRDIHKDYVTVVGRPSGRGEAGGNIRYNLKLEKTRFNSNLDVYRNRYLNNPEQDGVNFDWNGSMNHTLSSSSSWSAAAFVSYTPQLVSPHQSMSLTNYYHKRFPFLYGQAMSMSLGHSFQRNRYEESPFAEFDRNTLSAGFRIPLFPDVGFFANYDYSFVHNIQEDLQTYPQVFTAGVDYNKTLYNHVIGRWSLRYRNEENATGQFSFLSGEDSIRGTVGLSYRPNPGFEIYLDSNVRSVWTEDPDNPAFNDADVRIGFRSSWDTFFHWNPTGIFQGRVFNDSNGNARYDPGEEGLADIGVKVGDKTVRTNSRGEYFATVRAKKVRVALDLGSLPMGYINSDGFMRDIVVEHRQVNAVDFGLTSQAGIYGVVYIDRNLTGTLDQGDEFIARAKIILDGQHVAYSDFEGTYSFDNIKPGQHVISIDINSLPLQYIPLIKLNNEIEVGEGITYVFNIPLKEGK